MQSASDASDHCRRLAPIAPGIIAFLVDDERIFIVNSNLTAGPKPHVLQLDQQLPVGSKELIASPTEHGTFAVVADHGVAIVECANSYTTASVIQVGKPMFLRRPSLKVLHAAWSPHADAFLGLLTTDEKFRLYDVASRKSAEVERVRLRVVTTGSGPVSFVFGRGAGWDSLSVYALAGDGAMYVASPIVAIGTRISLGTYKSLCQGAESAVQSYGQGDEEVQDQAAAEGDPFADSSSHRPNDNSPSSKLSGGTSQRDAYANGNTWTNRQSEMQLLFLKTVFEPTQTGDEMIAVRECKPASVLFQGPLYVEQDDASSIDTDPDEQLSLFRRLTLIQHGFDNPPVFLRSTADGRTSVLILMELVEAQWFLGFDSHGGHLEGGIPGGEEYAQLAKTVAPSLLCFEHIEFPGRQPVQLFPLAGKADCNVLFAVSGAFVYSVRLPFLSILDTPRSLEVCPASTISPLLDTRTIRSADASGIRILGLAQSFERGFGPLAVVVDSNFAISITPSVRWTVGVDHNLPPPIVDAKPSAETSWNNQRPLTGNRAFACVETGREVMEAMQELRAVDERQGWNVADGTLTTLNEAEAVAPILAYLETRVTAYVGSSTHQGVGDTIKSLSSLVANWSGDLEKLSRANLRCMNVVRDEFHASSVMENSLRRKVKRATELNENLRDRIAVVRTLLETGSGLSEAERERSTRLKEKKRRVVALRKRLEELTVAVKAVDAPKRNERQNGVQETMTPARYSQKRWSTSGAFSQSSPLERRREDWIKADERIDIGPVELRKIREALETHSKEIAEGTDMCASLWQQLSSM